MYKRVKLAEKRGVRRQVRFEERARLLVRRGGGDQPMAREHATRGRVGDGHRPAGRIEQDLIDGLRAETRQREQLVAKRAERRATHAVKAPAEPRDQPRREPAHAPRLEPRRPRRANGRSELRFSDGEETAGIEETTFAQR